MALLQSRQLLFEFSLAIGRLPVFPTSVGSLVPLWCLARCLRRCNDVLLEIQTFKLREIVKR